MKILLLAATAAFGLCGAAYAADPAGAEGGSAAPPLRVAAPQMGPLSRTASFLGSAQISGGSDDSSVSAQVSWPGHATREGDHGAYTTANIVLSAPLDSNAKSGGTDLASLDGLADSTSLEIKFAHISVTGLQMRPGPGLATRLSDICDRARTAYTAKHGEAPDKDASCAAIASDDPTFRDEWEGAFWSPRASALAIGGGAKVGYRKFDFLNTTTLASQSDTHTPWSVSAFVSWFPRSGRTLISGSYEHQEAYKEADSKTVCPAGTPPVTCITGALGAPTRSQKDLFSLEGRHMFTDKFGLAATVSYDAKADVWGVETPIYLVRDAKGEALTGGVKLGWRSDDHDVRASIFIGKSFSVLNF